MSLFNKYSNGDLTRVNTEYTPTGKVFQKKREASSGLFQYFEGITKEQGRLIDGFNSFFDGLFPKISTELLEYHEFDLGIPDNTFSGQGSLEDRQRDVVVKKYMMRGNRLQDFYDIATIYGVAVRIRTGLQATVFPLSLPLLFASTVDAERHTLYIELIESGSLIFPLPFPVQFAAESNVDKIKKIYNHIKPATTRIIYL